MWPDGIELSDVSSAPSPFSSRWPSSTARLGRVRSTAFLIAVLAAVATAWLASIRTPLRTTVGRRSTAPTRIVPIDSATSGGWSASSVALPAAASSGPSASRVAACACALSASAARFAAFFALPITLVLDVAAHLCVGEHRE